VARADLKQRVAADEISASALILNSPSEASGWAIGKLLGANVAGVVRSPENFSHVSTSSVRYVRQMTGNRR
jgi:hypothetical protein